MSIKVTTRDTLTRYIKIVYIIISLGLILTGLIWISFILKGYLKLGHLPIYGDPEIVSFSGFDRQLVIFCLLFYMYGMFTWAIITLSSIIFKLKIITWTNLQLGLIGIAIDYLITLTPQFMWLLD